MILKRDRQFNIVPSHAELRTYIRYYNFVFPGQGTFGPQYTLMPSACGTLSLAFDGVSIRAELWGASMQPVRLGAEPDRYRVLLLIQLSPCGLYQITRQSQMEFAGKRLSLADIDGDLYDSLCQAFTLSTDMAELADTCERILYRRIEKRIVSDALLLAAKTITDSNGRIQVKEVARQSRYSERHLNRLFLTQIGMNVKSYARLTRFNYVLKCIQKSPPFFAELSQRAGYFDQAHFDKDFKSIGGITPEAYVKTMSDFYYEAADIHTILSSKGE